VKGTRRTAQGLGVLALVVPLSGLGLLVAAGPAYATTGITAPGNGVAFTSDTTVHIAATLDKNSGSAELRLTSPGSTAETVASASSSLTSGASLAYDFDTATCATYPSSCSGRAEAPNGVWTVTLVGGGRTLDSSTFTLRIAPRAPASLTAQADGYRAVVLTWPKGQEPDLTGWTVYADGSPGQDVGTDACSGTSCSTTVTYAQDGTGDHSYSLVAHRAVAPNSSDTLDSPQSPQATATLNAPPAPSPAPVDSSGGTSGGTTGGTSGGSTGGTSGGSTGGSTGSSSSSTGGSTSGTHSSSSGSSSAIAAGKAPATLAQRRAFALTFKAFAPKLGIPKLPPLPAQPAVAPLADGTYQKTLGYKDVVKREKVSTPQAGVRRVTGVVGSALDSGQFLRSIAGALVLLLGAAHLRRWLGSHTEH
jgi:hypothetical protein